MKKERGNVWLGVAGVVINSQGQWLVVKKAYSGLKGRWSLPAGFVNEGESVDQAILRELKEETGLDCEVSGLIGFRSGVIREEISDNMAIFYCQRKDEEQRLTIQEEELLEVGWIDPQELVNDPMASVLIKEIVNHLDKHHALQMINGINPGEVFGYTSYKLFL